MGESDFLKNFGFSIFPNQYFSIYLNYNNEPVETFVWRPIIMAINLINSSRKLADL